MSVQALPVIEEGGVVRVAVSVTLQGSVDTLQKTLYGLESQVPLLFMDDLQVTARQFRPRLPDGKDCALHAHPAECPIRSGWLSTQGGQLNVR
ncbi:MAG: hypothetical protein H6975_09330 [Gammaproteobacteria bacterium]|nr:hypothetical protein [Gammaproteobacteria bacterium]